MALRRLELAGAAAAVGAVTLSTTIAWYGFGRGQLPEVVMMFLLGVVVVSMRFGYGPSLLAAVLGVIAFDFFFVPPYFSFGVSDLRHTVTFGVMLLVGVVISHLTQRIRNQADSARQGERRMASLYALSRELGVAQGRQRLLEIAGRHIREVFGARVAALTPESNGMAEAAVAGPGTLAPDERQLLDTFRGLIRSAIERADLAEEARKARLRVETEQLRNSLLSSVSHDLRTPLAVITGATSSLLDGRGPKDPQVRRDLLQTAHEEALRLNRLVGNLLDMTRLEAGALQVKKEPQPVEEVVGSALARVEDRLQGREVNTDIPLDMPLVPFDSALVEQVLINLLENATKYTAAGSPIDVSARIREDSVEIDVADRGPGVDPLDHERVFEKFYRAREREGGGVGLGLTICRGIVSAHGGRIRVDDRPGGGAVFRFTLPLEAMAPSRRGLPEQQESHAR